MINTEYNESVKELMDNYSDDFDGDEMTDDEAYELEGQLWDEAHKEHEMEAKLRSQPLTGYQFSDEMPFD